MTTAPSEYTEGIRALSEIATALRVLSTEAHAEPARADLSLLAGSVTILASRFERLRPSKGDP